MRATRVFRARYRLPVRRIKVKNDLTAIVADKIRKRIKLVFVGITERLIPPLSGEIRILPSLIN